MTHLQMARLTQENGETTTRTRYRGGFHLDVLTEFAVGDATYTVQLTMAQYGDDNAVHLHTIYAEPGFNSTYPVSHQYVFHERFPDDEEVISWRVGKP